MSRTPYTETEAMIAVLIDDERLAMIFSDMTKRELAELARAADRLAARARVYRYEKFGTS